MDVIMDVMDGIGVLSDLERMRTQMNSFDWVILQPFPVWHLGGALVGSDYNATWWGGLFLAPPYLRNCWADVHNSSGVR